MARGSFLTPQQDLDDAEERRGKKVRWFVGNPALNLRGHLYEFCVDVLGYDALSEEFHKPMLDAWDRMDLRRFRYYLGLEEWKEEAIDSLDLWPRGHIKTWCERARVIRYYLFDPQITVTWWHAVEDKAVESAEAIADHLQKTKKLRALFPVGVLPAMNRKKFVAGGDFRLNGQKVGDAPSMVALGAGGEGTGGHSFVGVLDDFVGWNDVVDGQMEKKKQFYRATVCNVVQRTKGKFGWKDCIGTHWAIDDPYVEWRESPDWKATVRACIEDGKPIYLSEGQVEKERREQGTTMFAFQMMNDPSPDTEKPWVAAACEQTCTLAEAKGQGWVVALSDPAPRAVGALGWEGRAAMKAGTKNWWASVVVKLVKKGDSCRILLLDGEQSKDWGLDEGMDAFVKLAMKWKAHEGYAETTSTPVYSEAFLRSKKELGWRGYAIGSRRHADKDDRLRLTYNANAKAGYLVALADRAKAGEVIVAESFPEKLREEFWKQMRGFMPRPDGSTGIPFDDLANAIAFATDPYFRGKYPAVSEEFSASPYRREEEDAPAYESRYISF